MQIRPVLHLLIALGSYATTSACEDADISTGSLTSEITIELENNDNISDNKTEELIGGAPWAPFSHTVAGMEAGEAVYVKVDAEITSSDADSMLHVIRLKCDDDVLKTSENHVGTGINSYFARWLFVADSSGDFTCQATAEVWPHGGGASQGEWHTYVAGPDTFFGVGGILPDGHHERWGTEADSTYGDSCSDGTSWDCTYIGNDPDLGANSEEYVLRSPRFNIPSGPTALTVYGATRLMGAVLA